RGVHTGQSFPCSALLADLMRLESIEIAKTHLARLDPDGAGRQRRLIQLEAARRAYDDAVESIVLAAGAAAGPYIRCRQIGALADGIGAYFAARLNFPCGLVLPHLCVGQ